MDNSVQYGQQDFNLPHDVLKLPSEGRFYKNQNKTLKIGYLTAQDENLLVSTTNNDSNNVITNLVRNKIYEPGFDHNQLLEGDFEAILIFLRNTSFGPEYNFRLTDPKTKKEFNTTIMLDELDFVKTKFQPNENGLFEFKLPKSNSTVECKLLNIGEIDEINRTMSQYPQGVTPPTITTKLTKQIVSVDGNTDKEFISKFVINLPIMDSKFIRNTLSECEPKIDLERKIYAPSGEEVSVRVTFGVEFFRPFF